MKLKLNENYFAFNEKFYKETDGVTMCSPLSGILADIYLNNIENKQIVSDQNKQLMTPFYCLTAIVDN